MDRVVFDFSLLSLLSYPTILSASRNDLLLELGDQQLGQKPPLRGELWASGRGWQDDCAGPRQSA